MMNDNLDETTCPSNKEDYHLPLDENPYIRHSTTPCNTQVDLDETPYFADRNPTRDRPCPPRLVNPQIGITPIATQTVDPTVALLLHQMQRQQQAAQIQLTRALETLRTRPITVINPPNPPRLPPLCEGIAAEADLASFEKHMTAYDVPRTRWAAELSTLLQGISLVSHSPFPRTKPAVTLLSRKPSSLDWALPSLLDSLLG